MYKHKIKPSGLVLIGHSDDDIVNTPCRCLGSRIRDQMYHGIDSSNSTLLSGEFDDDDSWDVDPACDMRTDRFTLDVKTPVPSTEPTPSE